MTDTPDGERIDYLYRVSLKAFIQNEKGEVLVVMEAMKMEMTLSAPRDGVLAEIVVSEGAQIAEGAMVLRLKAEEAAA